jgi:hypothetical protein
LVISPMGACDCTERYDTPASKSVVVKTMLSEPACATGTWPRQSSCKAPARSTAIHNERVIFIGVNSILEQPACDCSAAPSNYARLNKIGAPSFEL